MNIWDIPTKAKQENIKNGKYENLSKIFIARTSFLC